MCKDPTITCIFSANPFCSLHVCTCIAFYRSLLIVHYQAREAILVIHFINPFQLPDRIFCKMCSLSQICFSYSSNMLNTASALLLLSHGAFALVARGKLPPTYSTSSFAGMATDLPDLGKGRGERGKKRVAGRSSHLCPTFTLSSQAGIYMSLYKVFTSCGRIFTYMYIHIYLQILLYSKYSQRGTNNASPQSLAS